MKKETGIITVTGNGATISFERFVEHPIEKVWAAITDPEIRAIWFGPTTIEPKEGGNMETIAEGPPAPEDVRRTKAKILVWKPPHIFEYEEDARDVGNTVVRFELKTKGEKTILHLTNSRLKPSDASGYAPGWHAFLDRLDAYLDQDVLPDWGKRYSEVQSAYA